MNFQGDTIQITGLRVHGKHGVYDSEREHSQEFAIDAVLELDLSQASSSDEVSDTLHYGELAQNLKGAVAGEPVNLLETLADRLAGICLADKKVLAVTITIHKPQAAQKHQASDISVTIRRAKEDTKHV
jgi:7,8-dihydroneopterin aldolase/epimerase/oxygenase